MKWWLHHAVARPTSRWAAVPLLVATAVPGLQTWYGPATVTFDLEVQGDPYDPEQNDLRVRFFGEGGEVQERIAYLDEGGAWRATLVAPDPGRYHAVLLRNGEIVVAAPREGAAELRESLPRGFLRVDPAAWNRFRWDSGAPYYPLGYNLGWQVEGVPPMVDQIARMGESGITWTRIWASSWDGKNPWWPLDGAAPDRLWAPALRTWASLIDASERAGVAVQVVLFHHGAFSTAVNSDWAGHPWNTARGGFLRDPADFFIDAEARRRAKVWLRYAVARYAHSPSLMAWELFNEVEWTDAALAGRWADIALWHADMAAYLRSIDPHDHLVTTSSAPFPRALWKDLDYLQIHAYALDAAAAIRRTDFPRGKPAFFGEFGEFGAPRASAGRVLRDGIYAGLLGNHAGAPMFWAWDVVAKEGLHQEYRIAAEVLARSRLASHPAARPRRLSTSGSAVARALIEPGWAMLRLTAAPRGAVRIRGAGLAAGEHALTTIDLERGGVTTGVVRVAAGGVTVIPPSSDCVVILEALPRAPAQPHPEEAR